MPTTSGPSADQVIASLRTHHDRLAALVAGLDDAALAGPSGAAEWRICDVLSHLGSGAEIMLRPFHAAAEGTDVPAGDNQAVWDRWNALAPAEQAEGFVAHDATFVELLEGLDAAQRDTLRVDLGFLPEPVPLAVAAGMRLNEVAQHAWDAQLGVDPAATVDATAADLLLALYAGPLSFMLGFTAKPDALAEPTEVAAGAWALVVDDGARLVPSGTNPLATFSGAPEAFLRLLGGRLAPEHTPEGTTVTGSVTLDDLRRVFPGF